MFYRIAAEILDVGEVWTVMIITSQTKNEKTALNKAQTEILPL